jgi:hypothetical protein
MGIADTQVFSLGAADSSGGVFENVQGGVYLPHLSFVPRISRNTKLIV